jgi:hypothetical protein
LNVSEFNEYAGSSQRTIINGFQTRLPSNQTLLTRLTGKVKAKGYKINETDKEIVGQVDAILVLPNGKLGR